MEPVELSVLAVLVTSQGAATWLPEVLGGLAAQAHRPLDLVALDNATTDGSADLLLRELGERRVVRVEQPLTYARAVAKLRAVAAERGFHADAILLIHDDLVLDPGALDILVAALRIDGVGIAAPRLVDHDDPLVLQDSGQTTDRFGRAVPRVERGELDQGQIEGHRAVLFVQSAAMLVDAALLERIGGFDERFEALREDLDLCWRARICGALTVVAGDARARHVQATIRGQRPSTARGRFRELADRHLIVTLLKNYGWPRALLLVPVTVAISFANAILFLVGGRRRAALQVLRALAWNVKHLGTTLAARRSIQRMRTVGDDEVARLQHHGSRRVRAQVERLVERIVGGEVRALDDADFDAPAKPLIQRIRERPVLTGVVLATFLGFLATRGLFADGPLSGLDHGAFPAEPGGFFAEFASGWRSTSGAGAATPGMLLLGILSTLTFASTWLAHRLIFIAAVPLAAWSMARLARRLELGRGARIAAAVAYGLGPLVLGAFAEGRIIESLVAIGVPIVIGRLLTLGATATGRAGLGGAVIATIVVGSLAPWMLVLVLIAGATVSVARRDASAIRAATLLVGASLVALLPWSLELFRSGTPLLAGGVVAEPPLLDLVTTDPAGLLRFPMSFGLAAAAIVGASIARPKRRTLVRDLAALIVVGLVCAVAGSWVPLLGPRPALPLTLVAAAVAILIAFAAESVETLLARRQFGTPHLASIAATLLIGAQAVGTIGMLASDAHPGLATGRGALPGYFASEAEAGAFRILWLDGTSRRPSFSLSGSDGITMREHLERPAGGAYVAAARAVEVMTGRAGAAAGRILGTLGVRYVIVRATASEELAVAVGDQIELTLEQEVDGARIFRNAIDIPVATAMQAPAWARVSAKDLDAAQGVETNPSTGLPFKRPRPGDYEGKAPKGTRAILVGEPFHPGWRALVGDRELRPRLSFGWATGFDLPRPLNRAQRVRIDWRGQALHRYGIVAWIVINLALLGAWNRGSSEDLR
jgi:GT2 family glycosyltransferase